jgi:hypothetical protein
MHVYVNNFGFDNIFIDEMVARSIKNFLNIDLYSHISADSTLLSPSVDRRYCITVINTGSTVQNRYRCSWCDVFVFLSFTEVFPVRDNLVSRDLYTKKFYI